jgi:hypothetical protein
MRDIKMKIILIAPLLIVALSITACSGPDVGTKISSSKIAGDGVLAEDQKAIGMTILMTPRIEDLTSDSFNIRYMEASFGYGTPRNVIDMAIEQCKTMEKTAVHKGNSRGLIQLNTVKAYYECRDI